MSDYQPVSCEFYARFEHWIIRRQSLRVAWQDPQVVSHLEHLRPLDLQTRNHEEFLVARRRSGERIELRLDRIIRAEPV